MNRKHVRRVAAFAFLAVMPSDPPAAPPPSAWATALPCTAGGGVYGAVPTAALRRGPMWPRHGGRGLR